MNAALAIPVNPMTAVASALTVLGLAAYNAAQDSKHHRIERHFDVLTWTPPDSDGRSGRNNRRAMEETGGLKQVYGGTLDGVRQGSLITLACNGNGV